MTPFELANEVADQTTYDSAVTHLRNAGIRLPRFSQLANPVKNPDMAMNGNVDGPEWQNLFRVHWHNNAERNALTDIPGHIVLDESFTGVPAPIVVLLGGRFPMIGAHKVLPAYACLVTRLITGQFDPAKHRAIWPSTGNYCRGGVAISRILGCRGVAVLPEGMSKERFDWLNEWVEHPDDIIKTYGTESNVKEIYDKCAELSKDPTNVILNQFSEFANYLSHYQCTGQAIETVFNHLKQQNQSLNLSGFVAGTGSAGTIGAGDYLKELYGTKIIAMEPEECPTMLYNGYGEHNIQGIGDKHIPLIHNVMNTDIVAGISDQASDRLNVLINTDEGRKYLSDRRDISDETIKNLRELGLSGIGNVLAAIKTARLLELTENDAIVTIATDSGALYVSEVARTLKNHFPNGFDQISAGETYAQHVLGLGADHVLELTHRQRRRIFNLGYYTWVEQQGIAIEDFDKRLDQRFWKGLQDIVPVWDQMIDEFNRKTGVN